MKKLNPIAAAAAQTIEVIELTAIEREAALKLPMKRAAREVGKALAADLDRELQVAVERFLGKPVTDPEAVRGRLAHAHVTGEPDAVIYCMDAVPILYVGPITTQLDGDDFKGSRVLRHLLAEPGASQPPALSDKPTFAHSDNLTLQSAND